MTSARFTTDETDELLLQGLGPRPDAVWLDGPRARVDAVVTGGGKTWKARLPLATSRWGGPVLPLPGGTYALRTRPAPDAKDDAVTADSIPLTILTGLRASLDGGSGTLEIGPPVDPAYDSEIGRAHV